MKRSLGLMMLASLSLAAGAHAADVFRTFEGRGSYGQTGHDWSGAYFGGHAGYGWGSSTNDWSAPPWDAWTPDGTINYQSFTGGLQAGYQQQHENLVVRAEADLSLAGYFGNDSQFAGRVNEIEIGALGTLRGRLGWAHDNLLLFGTAGLAVASFDKRDTAGVSGQPQLAMGWTAGGGIEIALDEHWRVRGEYLHVRLGEVETGIYANGGGGYLHRANASAINILRTGLNYSF